MSAGSQRWEIQFNSKANSAVAIYIGAVGLLFVLIHSRFASPKGAFFGGLFMIIYAASVLLLRFRCAIAVDPEHHALFIKRSNAFGAQEKVVAFASVDHVRLIQNGVWGENYYGFYVSILLKDQTKIGTGQRYIRRDEAEDVARRLAESIGCPYETPQSLWLAKNVIYALVGAVLFYAAWYRYEFGQVCPAMWFGTAPIIIIGASFWGLLELMRNLRRP